ncbi:variable surface lipoprotein [Colwellia sp.]
MPRDNKESSNALQAGKCKKIMLWLGSISSLILIPMVAKAHTLC